MPSVCVRLDERLRATWLGTYSSSRIASATRSRVSGVTLSCPLITRDTVWCDTLAFLATSRIVARFTRLRLLPFVSEQYLFEAVPSLLTGAVFGLCYRSHHASRQRRAPGREGPDDTWTTRRQLLKGAGVLSAAAAAPPIL